VAMVRVAAVGDIPEGDVKVVAVFEKRVAIGNVEGRLYAFDDVCTHDGGPLGEGSLDGYEVECPRHGARFDIRDGSVLCLPATVGINTYLVRVEEDDVYIEI
jgi:3-phenylpropionate/trans-cinnamate dioxygenase ferredoxin subunit